MTFKEENNPHIVIYNGSGYIKAGFGGEECPRTLFPSYVGYPKYSQAMICPNIKDFYVGEDAEKIRGVLELNYPIEHGEIKKWDDMEKIWGHIFINELRIYPEDHNILITECSEHSKENREKIAQIMFETFNVNGLYISNPGVLSLYSAGKFTGFALSLGDGITQFVPIFDGFKLPYSNYFKFGGRDLTKYFTKIFYENGYRFNKSSEFEIVKNIKEKACYVALDYEEELRKYKPYDYILPDGNHIILTAQRIRVPEAIFQLNRFGDNFKNYNIQQTFHDIIQKYDFDIRKVLYNNIILSGGNSLFEGLTERLTKEIKDLAPKSMKDEVNIIAPPERLFTKWRGGSILCSISNIERIWITKDEYNEFGINIVDKKCF